MRYLLIWGIRENSRKGEKMKPTVKIIISAAAMILFMTVLPSIFIIFGEDSGAMGFFMLDFFIFNPILAIALGFMAGTVFKRLWWIPIALAVLFPPLFAIAIRDFTLDLYFYSVIYLFLGFVAMLSMCLMRRLFKKA